MNDKSVTSTPNQAPAKGNKMRWLAVLGLIVPLGAAGFFGWKHFKQKPARDFAPQAELTLKWQQPDALVESRSLSALPKELLEMPVLRDVLTEDFVFYYENNPDRLGLLGSLRRIVYEHDLQLQDTLINELLDEPATVALWKGGNGKLTYAALLIKRNGLSKLLEAVAKVALDDSQLSLAGVLDVDREEVKLYRFRYGYQKTLLFASYKDQLMVLTHPGMLLEGNSDTPKQAKEPTEAVEALLEGDQDWAKAFGLEETKARQRITVSVDYLAMGYRAFFPALAGVSLEKNENGWQTHLAYEPVDDAGMIDYPSVWRAVPMGASACVALPVTLDLPAKILQRLGATSETQKTITSQLQGPVGLCWYPESRLYTPLIVTSLVQGDHHALDAAAADLFEKSVGSYEANAPEDRFAVQVKNQGDGTRWMRTVGSSFGQYAAERLADPAQLASAGFFNVTLARAGDTLMFSLDDTLVDQAFATHEKRYPPLMDALPKDASVPVYIAPEKLAPLFRAEALHSLPREVEPVFRNAAETHLWPKLDKLAGYGKVAVTLPADVVPDDHWQWLPVTWKSL